jgi:hypothetical protein
MAVSVQDTDASSLSSIDLSCLSSDYELEYRNETTKGLLPYQFEPVDPEESQDQHALEEDSDWRLYGLRSAYYHTLMCGNTEVLHRKLEYITHKLSKQ